MHYLIRRDVSQPQGCWCDGWLLARKGYSGENGMELILPGDECESVWNTLMASGVQPVDLGNPHVNAGRVCSAS